MEATAEQPRGLRTHQRRSRPAVELARRERGWLEKPQGILHRPPAPTDVAVKSHTSRGRTHQRLSFASGYEPFTEEPGRDRWMGYTGNHREYALMLRHDEPRPGWCACGTEMGRASLDLTLFRAWHLHEDFGLNVVLPVLPMHGPRASGLPKGAVFPGEDVMDDVHATAQAVWDVRRCWPGSAPRTPTPRSG